MRAIPLFTVLLLAACTRPIETRIDSRGLTAGQTVSFAADPGMSGAISDAQKMVVQALLVKGYRTAEMADVSLQVTVSDRPANLSLLAGSTVLAPSSGKKRCAKREYRLGVTLTKIADGSLFYESHVAEFHCKLTVDQVLPALVDAALKDIAAPRGSYTVKRPR